MVRINYTNRKITGQKLAAICTRDIVKRISSGARAALRDSFIDLDLSSKDLADAAFREIASSILDASAHRNNGCSTTRLEVLSIKDNKLTALSLPFLTDVIRATLPGDLRVLDVSSNQLHISTPEELHAWEDFLEALQGTRALCMLNLSGNALGSKAFEILYRVYCGKPTTVQRQDRNNDECPNGSQDVPNGNGIIGLRGIPFVDLSDTTLDDASALHLSQVIGQLDTPDRIMDQASDYHLSSHATFARRLLNDAKHAGIIYLPNSKMSAAAQKVLDLAEHYRLLETTETPMDQSDLVMTSQKGQDRPHGSSAHVQGSSTSDRLGDALSSVAHELQRSRSRLEGNVIEQCGHRSNDLWFTALRLLVVARVLQTMNASTSGDIHTRPRLLAIVDGKTDSTRSVNKNLGQSTLAHKTANIQSHSNEVVSSKRHTLSSRIPVWAMPSALTRRRSDSPLASRRLLNESTPMRLLGGLAAEIWLRILTYTIHVPSWLSPRQVHNILIYGLDRQSLHREIERRGLRESAQIWHILDSMGCLSYE